MAKIEVNPLEYAGLLNIEKIARICLISPGAGEMLVGALQALNQLREDNGIPIVETPAEPIQKNAAVSDLASALIKRAARQ